MDDRDRLASYPFVVVRIACRVCTRSGSYRLARLAAKYGPEITLRDLTERFAPENVLRMLIESLDNVGVIERTFTPRAVAGDVEASKLVAQCRRQRARTAQLILERAPTSNPARFRRPWALRRAGPPLTGIGALSREL